MDEAQALRLAARILEEARTAGAESAEAGVSLARRMHVEALSGAIARLENSRSCSLLLRVFKDGRKATLASSDASPEGLRDAVRRAVTHTELVAHDSFAGLPDATATDAPSLDLDDSSLASRADGEKTQESLELERLVRGEDARIVNSAGSHYSDTSAVTALANSNGFSASYAWTRVMRSSAPVALDGTVKRVGHYGTAGRHLADLESLEAVASQAVRRAVELFGARKPSTMRVPVIFERDVAASVLEDLFAATSGANVASGNSWLAGQIGERVGSDLVTILDDGRLPGRLGSAPFDGEGVATRRTSVFQRGVLRTYLYDTYYARKLGAESTGNSTGTGIGPTNFYLEPGTETLDQLIARTQRGVLVLDTIGFATEHASGTYSRGARGFFIEGGEPVYPIDEFTIAARYPEMLAGIDAVADDLRFDGAVVSPSFRVAEMTVSGN
ncbi:MAG: TldD/PmbA family protein [Candidatus Eremiobacteraeota bacterium]|nr:TldD/PmbA family protein [Candidatus Eremiobacteraeota bacterium]